MTNRTRKTQGRVPIALLAAWGLAASPAVHAGMPARSGLTTEAAFARLKDLVGTWHGTDEGRRPVTIEFKVGARGTTVLETQDPGGDDEMISVYSRNEGELVMTHYCPMGPVGEQPHMRLDRGRSTRDTLVFEFTGGSNFDANTDVYVHDGRITWLGEGRLQREWDVYEGGRRSRVITFLLSRAR
jgi:hypothetical protein